MDSRLKNTLDWIWQEKPESTSCHIDHNQAKALLKALHDNDVILNQAEIITYLSTCNWTPSAIKQMALWVGNLNAGRTLRLEANVSIPSKKTIRKIFKGE